MTCAICSWSPDDRDYVFLYETRHWRVVLAPNQSLLGRCVVVLKRHAGDLAELSEDELLEWLTVVRTLEDGLRSAFGATMFNWSCYMNHAYRERSADPHVHWWAVPRYNRPVQLNGQVFNDPHFGSPYDHDRWLTVPKDVHSSIAEGIQQSLRR